MISRFKVPEGVKGWNREKCEVTQMLNDLCTLEKGTQRETIDFNSCFISHLFTNISSSLFDRFENGGSYALHSLSKIAFISF